MIFFQLHKVWQVSGFVLFDNGVIDGSTPIGLSLTYELEMPALVNLVVVVPLDTPQLGEPVVFEVEAGQRHHAVKCETALGGKGDAGISSIESISAQTWSPLILTGVECLQVERVNDRAVIAACDEVDHEVIGFLV